jgi:hypothetical protein
LVANYQKAAWNATRRGTTMRRGGRTVEVDR